MKLTNIILIDPNLILVEKENAFLLFEIEIQHHIRVVFLGHASGSRKILGEKSFGILTSGKFRDDN